MATPDPFAEFDAPQGDPFAEFDAQPQGDPWNARAVPGLKTRGNLDPWNRPVLKNSDGTVSTTSSISIGTDQGEVLIPTVINGKRLTQQEAIDHYRKTGEHLGVFDSPASADKYAIDLHNEQEKRLRGTDESDPFAEFDNLAPESSGPINPRAPAHERTATVLKSALEGPSPADTGLYPGLKPKKSAFLHPSYLEPTTTEPSWSAVAQEVPTAIGANIASRIGGTKEYAGGQLYEQAKKEFWQSRVLPEAVRRAKESDTALTEDEDVRETARFLGIRPDQFTRDWPTYVNMTDEERKKVQDDARARMEKHAATQESGTRLRTEAAQIASEGRPDLASWSMKSLAFDAATSAPDLLLAAGAATVGGPEAGIATMMTGVAPAYYSDAKNQGYDDRTAGTYATLMSIAEGVPELPVLEVLTHSPTGKAVLRKVVGKFAEKATGRIAGTAVLEGLEESITEALQVGIDAGVLDQHTNLKDGLERIARAGVVGSVMGGPVAAVTVSAEAGAKKLTKPREKKEAPPRVEPTIGELPTERPEQPSASARPEPEHVVSAAPPGGPKPKIKLKVPKPVAGATVEKRGEGYAIIEGGKEKGGIHFDTEQGAKDALAELNKGVTIEQAPAEEAAAPTTLTPGSTPVIEALKSVQANVATPEQVAMLEQHKLVTRNETNQPRLLPSGRRYLAASKEIESEQTTRPAVEPGTAAVSGAEPGAEAAARAEETRQPATAERAGEEAPTGKPSVQPATEERVPTRAVVAGQEVEVNTTPTEAQKEAGNYQKGHITFQGMPVAIENPKGSTRSGVDESGKKWERTLTENYGYVKRSEGADGDQVDVFVGKDEKAPQVFVVDQMNPKTGKFDEHKAMLGYKDQASAEAAYASNYPKGWQGKGNVTAMSTDEFKSWLKSGETTRPLFSRQTSTENETPEAFSERTKKELGLQDFSLTRLRNGVLRLNNLTVPRGSRKQGVGSEAMQRVIEYADRTGERVQLTTAEKNSISGTTSSARLRKFYKRFGFERNRGRKRDFTTRDNMIREGRPLKLGTDLHDELVREPIAKRPLFSRADFRNRSDREMEFEGKMRDIQRESVRIGKELEEFAKKAPEIEAKATTPLMERQLRGKSGVERTAIIMGMRRRLGIEMPEAESKFHDEWGRKINELQMQVQKERQLISEYPDVILAKEDIHKYLRDLRKRLRETEGKTADIVQLRPLKRVMEQETATERKGMRRAEVVGMVGRALRGLYHPSVQIAARPLDLPRSLYWQLVNEKAEETTGGVFLPDENGGTVYLIAENLHSEEDVMRTLAHELVGHYGIRKVMTVDDYNELMDRIWKDMPGQVRMSAVRNSLDVNDETQRRYAAEEVIAYTAQKIIDGRTLESDERTLWQKVLAAIRKWLDLAFHGMKMTDEKIAQIVMNNLTALRSSTSDIHQSHRPMVQSQLGVKSTMAPLYYSQLWDSINSDKVAKVSPPEEYAKIIESKTGKEVKPEEMNWIDVVPWLRALTYSSMVAHLPSNIRNEKLALYLEEVGGPRDMIELAEEQDRVNEEADEIERQLARRTSSREPEDIAKKARYDELEKRRTEIGLDPRWVGIPKRIPKSAVLDYIQHQQVEIEVRGPTVEAEQNEEEGYEWLGQLNDDGEVVDEDEDYLQESAKEDVENDPDRTDDIARNMLDGDPDAYIPEEFYANLTEDDMLVESELLDVKSIGVDFFNGDRSPTTTFSDDAIDRLIAQPQLHDDAVEKHTEDAYESRKEAYYEDPVRTWSAVSESGDRIEVTGSEDMGYTVHINNRYLQENGALGNQPESFRSHSAALSGAEQYARENGMSDASPPDDTEEGVKWSQYTLEGGEDYGERLFIFQNRSAKQLKSYRSGHWDDDDVIAHVRFDTRWRPGPGETYDKVLFLDELQSDWHQSLRDEDTDNEGAKIRMRETRARLNTWLAMYDKVGSVQKRESENELRYNESPRDAMRDFVKSIPMTPAGMAAAVSRSLSVMNNNIPYEIGNKIVEWMRSITGLDYMHTHSAKVAIYGEPSRAEVGNAAAYMKAIGADNWNDFVDWVERQDKAEIHEFRDRADDYADQELPGIAMLASEMVSRPAEFGLLTNRLDAEGFVDPESGWRSQIISALGYWMPETPEMRATVENALRAKKAIKNEYDMERRMATVDAAIAYRHHGGFDTSNREYAQKNLDELMMLKESFTHELAELRREITGNGNTTVESHYVTVINDLIKSHPARQVPADMEALIDDYALHLEEAVTGYNRAVGRVIDIAAVKVPPLSQTWPTMILKWAVREAIDNNMKYVALAPGSMHGVRWQGTSNYGRAGIHGYSLMDFVTAIDERGTNIAEGKTDGVDPWLVNKITRMNRSDAEEAVKFYNESSAKGIFPVGLILHTSPEASGTGISLFTMSNRLDMWIGKQAATLLREKIKDQVDNGAAGAQANLIEGGLPNYGLISASIIRNKVEEPLTIWGPSNSAASVLTRHSGMMEVYNNIIPLQWNKFLSKYGAKIAPGRLRTSGRYADQPRGYGLEQAEVPGYFTVPMVEITEKLKEAALNKGFPLFSRKWAKRARKMGQAINNGTNDFDPADQSPASRIWNYLVFKAQDKFIDLFRTQQEVAAWRGMVRVSDRVDAYLKQTLYPGRVEQRIKEYEKQFVDPLVAAIKESGFTWADVENFLYARHAPEANARYRKINPNDPTQHSGMTDAEAAQVISDLALVGKLKNLIDIGLMIDRMTKWNRDTMVMEGLEDAATIKDWENTYQYYVPLKGWADGAPEAQMPKKGRGFDTGGKITKQRTGRTSKAGDILANIVASANATLILAEKAKVNRALYDFVSQNPSTKLWSVDEVEYMKFIDPSTGLVRQGVNPTYKLQDNVIRVKIGGKDFHITFNPEVPEMLRLAQAFKNLGTENLNAFLAVLHGINRVLSSLSTSLNPEFTVTNMLRDIQTAMVTVGEAENAPFIRTKILADWRKAWWAVRRGEQKHTLILRGKKAEWADQWIAFKRAGGKTGWIDHYSSMSDLRATLQRKLGPGNVLQYTVSGVRAILDFVENENLAVENALRLSAFVHLQNAGLSEERAAEFAKNLTVNFNKKGDAGIFMNSLYLFYNASMQGTATVWRIVKNPRTRRIVYGIVAAGIANDILMRFIGGDDDDKEKLYDKIDESEKERNWIFMIPPTLRWKDPAGNLVTYVKVPLPWGFNTFFYTGTKLGKYVDYGFIGNARRIDPAGDAALIGSTFLGSFSPIGDAVSAPQFVSPTVTDPVVQLSENKTWYGGPIMPEDYPGEPPSPDSQKYFDSVPGAYRDITTWLNAHTGGTDVTPGTIDVSPETVQFWVDFAGGGLARFLEGAIDVPVKAATDVTSLESREIPFYRRVIGTIGDRQTNALFLQHLTEVNYARKEIQAIYQLGITTPEGQQRLQFVMKRYPVAVKLLREAYPNFATGHDIEDIRESKILKQLRDSIIPAVPMSGEPRPRKGSRRAITSDLSDARKELKRLQARVDMPAKERTEKINAQKEVIRSRILDFNRMWNEVEDSTFGPNHGRLLEMIGPMVSGKPRREAVKTLRQSGLSATADLLGSLPPTPDRFAQEFFNAEASRP